MRWLDMLTIAKQYIHHLFGNSGYLYEFFHDVSLIMFWNLVGSVTLLITDVTNALGINTKGGGIGGVIGGTLNLLSVGTGNYKQIAISDILAQCCDTLCMRTGAI